MTDITPFLKLLKGGGEIVDTLEVAAEEARAGEIDGVIVITIGQGNRIGWAWAHKDDTVLPWTRLVTAVAATQHDLIANGLDSDD